MRAPRRRPRVVVAAFADVPVRLQRQSIVTTSTGSEIPFSVTVCGSECEAVHEPGRREAGVDLAGPAERSDSGRFVDALAAVARRRAAGFGGVHAHSHLGREAVRAPVRRQAALDRGGAFDRRLRVGECDEEPVSGVVDSPPCSSKSCLSVRSCQPTSPVHASSPIASTSGVESQMSVYRNVRPARSPPAIDASRPRASAVRRTSRMAPSRSKVAWAARSSSSAASASPSSRYASAASSRTAAASYGVSTSWYKRIARRRSQRRVRVLPASATAPSAAAACAASDVVP